MDDKYQELFFLVERVTFTVNAGVSKNDEVNANIKKEYTYKRKIFTHLFLDRLRCWRVMRVVDKRGLN